MLMMEKCKNGHPMVPRTGRYGTFYGCSKYPYCNETKAYSASKTKKSSNRSVNKNNVYSKKICSQCNNQKIRIYQRGGSVCDSCKIKYTKTETERLMDSKPIRIETVTIPEPSGAGPGSKDSEEFGLMKPLLTYYEMCSRGTRRVGGLKNIYENATRGQEVLDVVEYSEVLNIEDFVFTKSSDALVNIFTTSQINPETNPIQFGSLWVIGNQTETRQNQTQKIRVCAPLLIYDLEVQYTSGNSCEVTFPESYPSLNYPLVEFLADIRGVPDGGVAFAFENLLDLLPEFPLKIESINEFLKALNSFLPSNKIEVSTFEDFENYSFENPFESELKIVNTFAIFKGVDLSPLTVVKEIEALQEVESFEDTALLNALLPVEYFGTEEYEYEKFEGNTENVTEEFTHEFEFLPLSQTQREVIKSVRSRPMTLVTGPPGTGKSHTITAVILDYIVTGRKVLFTSNTKKAVEVVVEKLEELCGPFVVAMSGGRKQQNDLAKKLEDLTNPGTLDDCPTIEELDRIKNSYAEKLEILQKSANELENSLGDLTQWSLNQDIVKKFLNSDIEPPQNKNQNVKKLIKKLEKAKNKNSEKFISKNLQRRIVVSVAKSLEIDTVKIINLEAAVEYLEALQNNETLTDELKNPINKESKISKLWEEVQSIDQELRDVAVNFLTLKRKLELKSLLSNPKNNRQVSDFRNALKRADNLAKKEILESVSSDLLLKLFPCWASTDNFLSHILPLEPRMFHLSVIDEASYCRVDSAIPTLYRAKKALVVGDPNQLKPVMFLPNTLNNAAIAKSKISKPFSVTYNFKRPLFDVVSENLDLNAKFMLDEHFRSEQEIIKFSSTKFYKSKLVIMTQKPRHLEDYDKDNGLNLVMPINVHYVDGKRDTRTGPNKVEAEKAIELAKTILNRNPDWTIGILTPFRSQADYGTSLIGSRFKNNEILKSKLLFDTAHQLQGDERDAIIISFTLDSDFATNQLNWMQDETGVFNVSITRARKELHIVSSLQPSQLPQGLFKEFLEYAEDSLIPAPPSNEYDSKFEEEVAVALAERQIRVIPQFEAAGYLIDLVVQKNGITLGVECDGPSHFDKDGVRTERDLERHMRLTRAGWNLHRISYIDWEENKNEEINKVLKKLRIII